MPPGLEFIVRTPPELRTGGRETQRRVDAAMQAFAVRVERSAQDNASGRVLQRRSGRLAGSIRAQVRRIGNAFIITLGAYTVYARIHEKGGVTPPHIIRPRNPNGVLVFEKDGRTIFAKIVHHPGSRIPARPYLQPALQQHLPWLLHELLDAYAG